MAEMTASDLTNLYVENYGSLIVDNVVREGVGNWLVDSESLLGSIRDAGMIEMGGADGSDHYVAEWAVKTGGKTATSFGASDAYPVDTQPTWIDASLGWKRTWVMVSIDNLERLKSRRGSLRAMVSGFQEQISDGLKALMADVETQLQGDGTGNSAKDIDGFKAWLSTSNTYATISQSGQALWQANITAAGSVALSNTLMRTMVRAAYNRNAIDSSTEIWMSLLQFQKFSTLFADNVRYSPNQAVGAPIPYYTDGNFSIPIKVKKGVPTDEVWMPKRSDIEFRFLDHTPDDELSEIADATLTYQGLPIAFEPVTVGKDAKAIVLKVYANARCKNPYHQSAITGLATTAP